MVDEKAEVSKMELLEESYNRLFVQTLTYCAGKPIDINQAMGEAIFWSANGTIVRES